MSAGGWTVWSFDARSSQWMEVARGTKREMAAAYTRKKDAAAKHLPSARFALCAPGEAPHHVPSSEDGGS